jgi:DNA-directed RNA polymerase subunit RPC12/RpoP
MQRSAPAGSGARLGEAVATREVLAEHLARIGRRPGSIPGGAGPEVQASFVRADNSGMSVKRTWVCLSCGAAYEVRDGLLPLRCWDCRARLVQLPGPDSERTKALQRHPSTSAR